MVTFTRSEFNSKAIFKRSGSMTLFIIIFFLKNREDPALKRMSVSLFGYILNSGLLEPTCNSFLCFIKLGLAGQNEGSIKFHFDLAYFG